MHLCLVQEIRRRRHRILSTVREEFFCVIISQSSLITD
jgi:hypothetical protein